MYSVTFEPPITIEECRLAGRQFGGAWGHKLRSAFEVALTKRLTVLTEAMAPLDLDLEEAIAAFDEAAWDAWEAASKSMDAAEG